MKIYTSIEALSSPLALTIGNFDGLHLGHRAILERVSKLPGQSALITFSNHPATILRPNITPGALITQKHKLRLIESAGIDHTLLLPFTKTLSELSANDFLKKIRTKLPFSHLILGHDATLGHNREGNTHTLPLLADKFGFTFETVKAEKIDHLVISSSAIRKFLKQGNLEQVKQMLGRKYSLLDTPVKGLGLGQSIGYSTINFSLEGLCTPPFGVYAVKINDLPAVANLGLAPTVRKSNTPLLEVHLLNDSFLSTDNPLKVVFHQFIRNERCFSSIDELKEQIQRDIDSTKSIFH